MTVFHVGHSSISANSLAQQRDQLGGASSGNMMEGQAHVLTTTMHASNDRIVEAQQQPNPNACGSATTTAIQMDLRTFTSTAALSDEASLPVNSLTTASLDIHSLSGNDLWRDACRLYK